jgi:hypothetical protein
MNTARVSLCIFIGAIWLSIGVHAEDTKQAVPERQSVDYTNEEIKTIIREVADKYELNVIIPDSIEGRASLKLRNAT